MYLGTNQIRSLILAELIDMGLKDVKPVKAGKQNYVFTYMYDEETRIAKVADSRHRSLQDLQTQIAMLKELSVHNATVCTPTCIKDECLIAELGLENLIFYVVAYPFVAGAAADIGNPKHIDLMAKSLAQLHSDMRRLPSYSFPKIVDVKTKPALTRVFQNLRGAEAIFNTAIAHLKTDDAQLLNGDFNAGNLKIEDQNVKIFDFDNCAYGSTAYELANTLYMVLFDDVTQGGTATYLMFKRTFLESYHIESGTPIEEQTIQDLIGYRVILLASWLMEPDDAPLFIQQSSRQWLDTLGSFVKTYFQ